MRRGNIKGDQESEMSINIKHRWHGCVLATGETVKAAAECGKADLWGAGLREADLSVADLRGADLRRADLRGANLRRANLTVANLRGANLRGADLSVADLRGADLREVSVGTLEIPVVSNIDAAILAAIETPGCGLEMNNWHTCKTTHCRAGWAIHLAGEKGYELEKRVSPVTAGALIYAVSRPGKRVPDFYASNEDALADLRQCAAKSQNLDIS